MIVKHRDGQTGRALGACRRKPVSVAAVEIDLERLGMALRNLRVPRSIPELESVILKSAGKVQDLAMRFRLVVSVCTEQHRRPENKSEREEETFHSPAEISL